MVEKIRVFIDSFTPDTWPAWLTSVAICAGIAILAVITYYICIYLLRIVEKVIGRTPTDWDDDLLNQRLLRALSQLAPALRYTTLHFRPLFSAL